MQASQKRRLDVCRERAAEGVALCRHHRHRDDGGRLGIRGGRAERRARNLFGAISARGRHLRRTVRRYLSTRARKRIRRSLGAICLRARGRAPRRRAVRDHRDRSKGLLAEKPAGPNGFGYDPIFWYPGYGKTFGEVSDDEKTAVSHRGQAMRAFRNICCHA